MYVELSRWQESGKEPAAGGDLTNLQHIIERLQSYDPEKQFVVVFQSHGLMGAGRPLLSEGLRQSQARRPIATGLRNAAR